MVDASVPRAIFVLGKGGAGRSSMAAALGACFAGRGENTLIVQWSLADVISPWFGQPPAGHEAQPLLADLSVMNFSLDETLREYFVGHLKLRLMHDLIIANPHLRQLLHAGPGIAELFFCGRISWLLHLAREETGVDYRRIVIDAPATGHSVALFALPRMLAAFDAQGLLALERGRVARMLADPADTGAVVVTLAEELAVEETQELVPAVRRELGRPPWMLVVNRSVDRFFAGEQRPAWLEALSRSSGEGAALRALYGGLLDRKRRERQLRDRALAETIALDDLLLAQGETTPRAVVESLARAFDERLPA
jgi:anion-transporting  ArsA/GET3 family ATPase